MTPPPAGTVTLVFTDIQGSTALWERLGDRFQPVLDRHDQIMRDGLAEHSGYEVKTEGDAFMIAFASARDAVDFCLAAQLTLHDADWGDEVLAQPECAVEGGFRGVRVRMGVHTGSPVCRPDPVTGRMDYFGPVVNRAARVEGAAHGGQVFVSEAAWATASLPVDDLAVIDLGQHGLKGLKAPERLRQVLPLRLAERCFPAPRTAARRRTNLVPSSASFVGRSADLRSVRQRLIDGQRLVTLLGPGGTGKTTLARRVGADLLARLLGGVWFCDLADATSEAGVLTAVAAALEVPLADGNPVDRLGNAILGRGPTLLLFDNAEQVVADVAALISGWLDRAPEASFLVTSRTPLHLSSEQLVPLDPLDEAAGVQLFVDRAQQVKPSFALSDRNRDDVQAIVRELDALPLAIELAAARVRMLPPRSIRQRLKRRFDLLKGARRDVSDRQATLRGAIDGSWDLLEPAVQKALAQASVFAGSFTLEAAEVVLDLGEDLWPFDAIEALVDHSMLRLAASLDDAEPRYTMLTSIRAYSEEKLSAADALAAQERHAAFFGARLDLDEGEPLHAPGARELFDELILDRANLVAAIVRSTRHEWTEHAPGAARALAAVLGVQGPLGLGVELLGRVLALDDLNPTDRAGVARARAMVGRALLPLEDLCAEVEEALELARGAGAGAVEANLLRDLAIVRRRQGRLDEADALLVDAESHHRRLGQAAHAALDVESRANVAWSARDLSGAEALFDEALSQLRRVGSVRWQALALGNRGTLRLQRGRLDEAENDLQQALDRFGTEGLAGAELSFRVSLATLQRRQGRSAEAARTASEAIQRARALGDRRREALALAAAAAIDLAADRTGDARRGFEAARAIHVELGNRRSEAVALGNLGCALLADRDLQAAISALRGSVDLAFEGGWTAIEGAFRGALGEALAGVDEHAPAASELDRGERLLRDAGAHAELGRLLARRGRVSVAAGQIDLAAASLSELEAVVQKTGGGHDSELARAARALAAELDDPQI